VRWLYHLATDPPGPGDYAPASLASEGFIHCSFADAIEESARLYFPSGARVYRVDPLRLSSRIEIARTPRGPMPHVRGAIDRDAIRAIDGERPDRRTGVRFAFVAFPRMTLLDLVGVHDPISRIQTMGFDAESRCEIIGTSDQAWSSDGASLVVSSVRPALADVDVLVIPGGPGARELEKDRDVLAWLATYPKNRMVVSVCTGALLLGAMGRLTGRRATTHASAMRELARHGATAVAERVVDEGQVITAGGVTSGIDAGLHVVRRLMGEAVAWKVAAQMEVR
jgi:putative intracellular protease/amidase/uncharacterized protein (DUF952 family)